MLRNNINRLKVMGKALGALKNRKYSLLKPKFEHENWLENSRSGKNESVFDPKSMKFGFKIALGWTWRVNLSFFCVFEVKKRTKRQFWTFKRLEIWLEKSRSGKNGSVFDQKSMKFGFKMVRIQFQGTYLSLRIAIHLPFQT